MVSTALVHHDGVPLDTVRPAGDPVGGIVLLQEAFGVNDHIKSVARRLAGERYVVAAPHLFHRLPIQVLPYDDIPAAKDAIGALDLDDVLADIRAAVAWLASEDGVPGLLISTIGFCYGGKASYLAATALDGLAGCVVFYGGGIAPSEGEALVDRTDEITCPVLGFFGSEDAMIPSEEVGRVRNALTDAGVPHEVIVVEGANHGFFCDARPATYHAEAAAAAWDRTVAFLAAVTAGRDPIG